MVNAVFPYVRDGIEMKNQHFEDGYDYAQVDYMDEIPYDPIIQPEHLENETDQFHWIEGYEAFWETRK